MIDDEMKCSLLLLQINKTYMTSLAKRKQKVNELRKAHFPFGFHNQPQQTSEYTQEYPGRTGPLPQPVGDRRSHFTIGSDQPNMAQHTYQSEFKQKYPEHPQQSRAQAQRLNDQNNIVLGFQGGQQQTNYQNQFLNKQADRGKQVDQRAVHVDLGDTLTDFTTSYNKQFDGAQAPKNQRVDNNIRSSSLVLGFGNTQYQTSNLSAHSSKPAMTSKAVERSYATNIMLGGDNDCYNSEQKTQFAHKEGGYQSVDKDRVMDFRSAHFQMGFPEGSGENVSEAKANYHAKVLNKVQVEGKKPTNIQLKHDGNIYFQSSYGDHFQNIPPKPVEPLSKDGRKDNVVIGMGKETFTSEAKDQFGAKPIDRVMGKGPEGSLELGDGTKQFGTMYGNAFTDKHGILQQKRITKQEVVQKRKQNFVNGFSGVDYKLHSSSYGANKGETNKLSQEAISNMKGTNVVYGTDVFQGRTIQTSSYGWKQNEDF